jgi:hypothetical protein
MNNQNILRKGQTKLDARLDNSELYDFELLDEVLYKLDVVLDTSELYDYALLEIMFNQIDVVLDTSEFYDFKLSNIKMDNLISIYPDLSVVENVILTEDNFIFMTEDNYFIEYNG